MMGFEEFCEAVAENIRYYLPEKYQESRIALHTVNKVNLGSVESLSILPPGSNVSPTIYLRQYYEEYCDHKSMEMVLQDIADKYVEYSAVKIWDEVSEITEFSKAKDRLTVSMVNAKRNAEFLRSYPHQHFLDLAVMYEVVIASEVIGPGTARVTNEMLKLWGVSQEEVAKWAWENKLKNDPPVLYSKDHALVHFLTQGNVPIVNLFDEKADVSDCECFCLTSRGFVDGASSILYSEKLEQIREILGEDYYLLPTSVHDFMVVRKSFGLTRPDLKECLEAMNDIEPLDFLSESIYEYIGEEKRLMICMDFDKEQEKPKRRDHER